MADFYAILGVSKTATQDEIKKAYRTLALRHHPDRGGDAKRLQEINNAYEVLCDEHKKRLYDMGGADAVERGASRRQAPKKKTEAFVSPLKISLEDVYSGVTKKLKLTRTICCSTCKGQGGSQTQVCTGCKGQGQKTVMQRVGPGMVQQSTQQCSDCRGQGQVIKSGAYCKQCHGTKTEQQAKQFVVEVPPGAQDGQQIRYIGEGNETPGTLAGDVIIQFETKPHPLFDREGFHLFYTQQLSLFQALCGVTFYIEHLDGHQVQVNVTNVVKPGDIMCIPGQGLPHSYGPGKGSDFGNLYIRFLVEFPSNEHMHSVKTKGGPQWIQMLQHALPQVNYAQTQKPTGPTVEARGIVNLEKTPMVDEKVENKKWERERNQWKKLQTEQDKANRGAADEHEEDEDVGGGMDGAQMGCQQM